MLQDISTWCPSEKGEEAAIDSTSPARSFTYNHLAQLTQVTVDAGIRSIGYNQYGNRKLIRW